MSKVVRVNFVTRRRVTVLRPADPTYIRGPGVHIQAKPNRIDIEFDAPVQFLRFTQAELEAWAEKFHLMAMTAELLGEDGEHA